MGPADKKSAAALGLVHQPDRNLKEASVLWEDRLISDLYNAYQARRSDI